MVRCSIKRLIKLIIYLCILIVIRLYFHQPNKISIKDKSFDIVILSDLHSKNIQRVILFFNELRLSYKEYRIMDYHLIEKIPTIIIIDRIPDQDLYKFINQYKIKLLILMNNQCVNCVLIKYSKMLFENVTYPTMDFHRNDWKPVLRSTASPFKIRSNSLISLLKFKNILPVFHIRHNQCVGQQIDSIDPIIYVEDKLTFAKINLFSISSTNEIYLSECLFSYWFIWPLIMDIIRYLTSNQYDYHGLTRYIQIDIDDVFLGGKTNDRWKSEDIQALIHSQLFIRNYVKGFRYRLGFSGFYCQDNEADRLLIKEKDQFIWFHHTWKHEKLTNIDDKISLIASTNLNLDFAQKYKLPLDPTYAVAPHHTGIYPINPVVYEIWSRIMNINVTSTENYPYHFDISSNRRGFIYRGLSVLPRQSCELYTSTRNYTNTSHHLEQYLMGGKLFRMILTNPITIFMSHNVNYGHDRLGNYVFSKLVYLMSSWTRIQLSNQLSTSDLARKYFYEYYPDEQMPVFTNPCNDQTLLNLWNGNRSMCQIFPRFLIVGPQKTGTTALHSMLSQHPDLHPSKKSLITYEELQFFSNDSIYLNGINWYLNQFNTNSGGSINFEKSATYFDSLVAIKRIKALLPDVRLIMMFAEPGARAYSRYQHEMARTNQTLNFDELLRFNPENKLRKRCLEPGHYAEHLIKWLKYFPSKQIYIIDSEAFRRDPRDILNDLQISFLHLKTPINASKLVRYNKKKGFFCPISSTNHFQCLGNSKGRHYSSMSSYSREYLNNSYLFSNEKLVRILQMNNYSLPSWLSDN